ncbi:hypothetical protein GLP02_24585, partial [Escherichia coli]|nr:hypothetical protein [Escherichia coli]
VSVAKVSISGLPRFTVSIGVAHHEGNESINELFKHVDDPLYRAQNDVRIRLIAASAAAPSRDQRTRSA